MILKKINHMIFRVSGVVCALLLFAIVGITFTQVLARYIFKFSLTWSSEVTVFVLEWMVFLACSMGYHADMIASLTLVTDRLPPKVRSAMKIVAALCMIFFMAATFYGNMEIIAFAKGKVSSVLGINMQFVYSAWSTAAVLMTLYSLEKIYDAVIEIKNGGDRTSLDAPSAEKEG